MSESAIAFNPRPWTTPAPNGRRLRLMATPPAAAGSEEDPMSLHPTFQAIFDQHFPPAKPNPVPDLVGAIRELLAEISPNARPDGEIDPRFACESMASAVQHALEAIKAAE